jgi:hypothetical protein
MSDTVALRPGVEFLNLGIHQPLSGRRPSNPHMSKPSTRWLAVQGTFQLESVEITKPISARRPHVGGYMLTPCDRARVQSHDESDIPQASHKRSQIASHCDGDLPDQVRALQSHLNADLHRPLSRAIAKPANDEPGPASPPPTLCMTRFRG